MSPRHLLCIALASLAASMTGARRLTAQSDADTFLDPTAQTLFRSAQASWASVDESIARYTAVIRQRIAAAVRTPLKDRIIYRNETAVRAFWDEDYDAVVQVLGTRSQYPGRSIAVREGDLDWLDDLPFDEPFDPGSDRLFLGLSGSGDDDEDGEDSPMDWIAHPLAEGADTLYRFQSGDTLTLSLPDGRALRSVRLDVLPRVADVRRITGTLWIEPESGALVRAVYRLSRQFDAIRDIEELQEEEERGSFRYVPGLFRPWTLDLTMIAVDYSLWDFEVWLPRSMRLEAEVAAGILKMPVEMDISYTLESVTTKVDVSGTAPDAGPRLIERHFETRAEAMAFIAGLLSEEDGVEYESGEDDEPGRSRAALLIVPEDRSLVATSRHLPPPIWENAAGFPSDDQLEEYVTSLANLPAPTIQGLPVARSFGWSRPDGIRYNRVEGLSVGGRIEAAIGGAYTLGATGFMGFADVDPKLRVDLERSSVRRRLEVGVYRELTTPDPKDRYLDFGNSVHAFIFGRDDGEYFRATGADLLWRAPVGARESHELRVYAERHEPVESQAAFSVFHAFGNWDFRPNLAADAVEEIGAELRLSPWRGGDALGGQIGLELYGQGARWRSTGQDAQTDYARASAVLRAAVPVIGPQWRLGAELGGGSTFGDAPLQRSWFLGGAGSLRGYPASVASGSSFARARLEVARTFDGIGSAGVFGDVGWAGERSAFDTDDLLYGIGVGGSVLDGLLRMDLSHGLEGPAKEFRIDFYLDALM